MEEKLSAFRYLIPRPQLRSQNQFKYFSEKLLLSQNLCYFRGSHFSHCFKLSMALYCLLPSKFLCYKCNNCFEQQPIVSSAFKQKILLTNIMLSGQYMACCALVCGFECHSRCLCPLTMTLNHNASTFGWDVNLLVVCVV